MRIDVGPWAEYVWMISSIIGTILTFRAEREAYSDVQAVRDLNGSVVGIAVRGTLAQERFRLAIQIIFLAVGIIALTTPPETPLTPQVVLLLLVPIITDLKTLRSLRDRRAITAKGLSLAVAERDLRLDRMEGQGARIEAAIAENTLISQGARDDAHEAVEVANTVNAKLAAQGDALIQQGVDRANAERDS